MTCRAHRQAIVDLARGVVMPAAVTAAAESHLAGCAACSMERRRQTELTGGLRALADASARWIPPASLERRFEAAVAAARRAEPAIDRHGHLRWWALAAAASILVVSWLYLQSGRAAAPAARETRAAQPAPHTASLDRDRQAPLPQPSERSASKQASGALPSRPRRGRATAGAQPPVRTVEFVAIPGAIGLPALESATIVRTELPVSVLPSYGVEIAADAARAAVPADVLVGQDGQARAIRLVIPGQEPGEPRSRE